jgi:hypothetical protein
LITIHFPVVFSVKSIYHFHFHSPLSDFDCWLFPALALSLCLAFRPFRHCPAMKDFGPVMRGALLGLPLPWWLIVVVVVVVGECP